MKTTSLKPPVRARALRGLVNYHSGQAAEYATLRHYTRDGYRVVAERWRSPAGEIDLIVERGGEYVFVEVKSSSTHARAAEMLSPRQIARIVASAEVFVGGLPRRSQTPMRFDVALYDRSGALEIVQNALAA